MTDESPAGRLRAVKRTLIIFAVGLIIFAIVIAVTVEPGAGAMMLVLGVIAGLAMWDATKSKIKLRRYREMFRALPDEDD